VNDYYTLSNGAKVTVYGGFPDNLVYWIVYRGSIASLVNLHSDLTKRIRNVPFAYTSIGSPYTPQQQKYLVRIAKDFKVIHKFEVFYTIV
jgi:hypothetical protein